MRVSKDEYAEVREAGNRMALSAIVPMAQASQGAQYQYSPGVLADDILYISGQVGTDENGTPFEDPTTQYVACFERIKEIVLMADLQMSDVVELVSFHTDFTQLDAFVEVKSRYFSGPVFPAWTSVAVAGLAQAGAIVEVQAKAVRNT